MSYSRKEADKLRKSKPSFTTEKVANSKSRGKQGNNNRRRKEEPETSAIGDNNPSWYIPDPMVMDQATRVSFSNFMGVDIELDPTGMAHLHDSKLKPGAAMQVFMNPSPGFTTYANPKAAAVNQQAFRTYARLSSINAKNTNYTPNDVATIILAVGELIKMFVWAQRAYGLMWTYNVRNRLMPANLVNLSGIDVELLSASAADFLTEFNTLIVQANRIPIPSNIEYFKHCAEQFSGVYEDSEGSMAELYIPLPFSTWDLEEDLVLEGTVLKTHDFWPSVDEFVPLDPYDVLDIIRNKIDVLLTSNTYNLVYSDIINLATKDPSVAILKFEPVSPTYSVTPQYDKEWLLKINNATIVGQPLLTEDQLGTEHTPANDIQPFKDILSMVYAPQWTRVIPDLGLQKLINFYNDGPSLEERVIATRLMFGSELIQAPMKGDKAPIATHWYTNDTVGMGDHYIVGLNVWTEYKKSELPNYTAIESCTDITTADTPSILTRFSLHPYIYEFTHDLVDGYSLAGLVGDLDFFTTLDFDTLARINKLALFALFDIKDVNKML